MNEIQMKELAAVLKCPADDCITEIVLYNHPVLATDAGEKTYAITGFGEVVINAEKNEIYLREESK